MIFYILSFSSLILTTTYLYFNKIVAKKYSKEYSFQIWFYSFIAAIVLAIFEFTNNTFFFDLKLAWIFIIIIWLKFAIRTILTEKVLKEVDAWYFEIFTKFNLIFMIIFEYLFLNYQIPIWIYFSFVIFFIWLTITIKFKSEKWLDKKNLLMLIIIAILFSIDPFLTRYIVQNWYLSLSLTYFFELWLWTIFIWLLRPKTVKFNLHYLKDFLPLALVRMIASYLAWKAILVWSPTIVELIKSCSLLLLFIIPIFIEKRILPIKTWIWIITVFTWVSLIIFFK
jgi:hypothetical protein